MRGAQQVLALTSSLRRSLSAPPPLSLSISVQTVRLLSRNKTDAPAFPWRGKLRQQGRAHSSSSATRRAPPRQPRPSRGPRGSLRSPAPRSSPWRLLRRVYVESKVGEQARTNEERRTRGGGENKEREGEMERHKKPRSGKEKNTSIRTCFYSRLLLLVRRREGHCAAGQRARDQMKREEDRSNVSREENKCRCFCFVERQRLVFLLFFDGQ